LPAAAPALDWPAGTNVATIKAISGGDRTSVT